MEKIKIGKVPILLALLQLCAIVLINSAYAITDPEALIKMTKYASMATAVSLSCIAAGIALSRTGAASVASVTEKPELFGRTMVYVGMAEGIAIYGLLIAFLIWVD